MCFTSGLFLTLPDDPLALDTTHWWPHPLCCTLWWCCHFSCPLDDHLPFWPTPSLDTLLPTMMTCSLLDGPPPTLITHPLSRWPAPYLDHLDHPPPYLCALKAHQSNDVAQTIWMKLADYCHLWHLLTLSPHSGISTLTGKLGFISQVVLTSWVNNQLCVAGKSPYHTLPPDLVLWCLHTNPSAKGDLTSLPQLNHTYYPNYM